MTRLRTGILILGCMLPVSAGVEKRPNVLFIAIDDLRRQPVMAAALAPKERRDLHPFARAAIRSKKAGDRQFPIRADPDLRLSEKRK